MCEDQSPPQVCCELAGDSSPGSEHLLPFHVAGHLFDLSSLSGKAGITASYSEKGMVFMSICEENVNCSPGVGECRSFLCLTAVPRAGLSPSSTSKTHTPGPCSS